LLLLRTAQLPPREVSVTSLNPSPVMEPQREPPTSPMTSFFLSPLFYFLPQICRPSQVVPLSASTDLPTPLFTRLAHILVMDAVRPSFSMTILLLSLHGTILCRPQGPEGLPPPPPRGACIDLPTTPPFFFPTAVVRPQRPLCFNWSCHSWGLPFPLERVFSHRFFFPHSARAREL